MEVEDTHQAPYDCSPRFTEPEQVEAEEQELVVHPPSDAGSRTRTLLIQYLNTATNNAYQEYEDIIKQIAYVALVVFGILVTIAYVYSQPGTGMRLKWRRSVRKLRRFSKNVLPAFKDSALWYYPYVQDVVNVAHIVLNQMFD